MILDGKKLTKAEEEEILKVAANISQARYKVENAKRVEKERLEKEERLRAYEAKEQKKRKDLYTSIEKNYDDLTNGFGIFDPREWELGDEGITGPPELTATVEPDKYWVERWDEWRYKGVALDLEKNDEFNKIIKLIGMGQRVKISFELVEPLPYEEWLKEPWLKDYLDSIKED